jgi:hypothetical protein
MLPDIEPLCMEPPIEPPIAGAGVDIDELVLIGMGEVCANAGARQSAASAAPAAAAVNRLVK